MKRKGIDAPLIPILFIVVGAVGFVVAWQSRNLYNFIFPVVMLVLAIEFIYTSLYGKYKIIHNVVESLKLPSNSKVLDLGTGHGAVLLEVAHKLKKPGEVIGIDIWQSADQSGNSQAATLQNIKQAQVSEVAKVETANMTKLPFNDNEFDYVFASLAIHNIKPKSRRELAINEALRVLKHGEKIVIIDMEHIGEFKRFLSQHGCRVTVSHTGINGLWNWIPTSIIIAEK